MSSNPYENEPGFEDANEVSDKKNQKDYVQKVGYLFGYMLVLVCADAGEHRFTTRHCAYQSFNDWKGIWV